MKKNQDHSLQCIDIVSSQCSLPPPPLSRGVSWKQSGATVWEGSGRFPAKNQSQQRTSINFHFKEVLSASDLSSARGRISRETRSQSFQGEGQALETILTRQLSNQLNNLELIPSNRERVSVIVPNTPSRSPRTSTPSGSPPAPTKPPRAHQYLGPITLPRNRSLSPSSGSDLSSIHGKVLRK